MKTAKAEKALNLRQALPAWPCGRRRRCATRRWAALVLECTDPLVVIDVPHLAPRRRKIHAANFRTRTIFELSAIRT